ncbi:ankyrin repeat domain-containing protein [Gammaproteobacteria bacterium]|nr:ankyrin repeat domain-containing protein [Gammaproteobacteria bacterium]
MTTSVQLVIEDTKLNELFDDYLELFNSYNEHTLKLQIAIQYGDFEQSEKVIEQMPLNDLSTKGEWGNTPLHLAINCGKPQIAQKLIEQLNVPQLVIQNNFGESPLDNAVTLGQYEVVSDLLEKIPAKLFGSTVLHQAIINDQQEIALILAQKMSPDQLGFQDAEGQTALHYALEPQTIDIDLAVMLMNKMHTKDLNITNIHGQTSHDLLDQVIEDIKILKEALTDSTTNNTPIDQPTSTLTQASSRLPLTTSSQLKKPLAKRKLNESNNESIKKVKQPPTSVSPEPEQVSPMGKPQC